MHQPEIRAGKSAYRHRAGQRRVLAAAISMTSLALVLAGCGGGSKSGSAPASGATGTSSAEASGGANPHAAANGVSGKSAKQIVTAAVSAIDRVSTVHVTGSVANSGVPVRMNLHLVRGRGGEGQVSENGLGFKLIAAGHYLYIEGSDAFWTHYGGATAAKVFHNRWLKAPDSGQFASIGELTDISGLFGRLLTQHGALIKGHRATIAGQPAIGVTDRTRGGTLYVATTGHPYPLELLGRGSTGGYVTFTGFNQPVNLVPPAHVIPYPRGG